MNSERELLRKRYYGEIERTKHLSSSLNFPKGIMTMYFTFVIYIVKKFYTHDFVEFDSLYFSIIKNVFYIALIKWVFYLFYLFVCYKHSFFKKNFL